MADKTMTVKTSGGDYTSLAAAISGEVTANADLTASGLNGILTIECYAMEDTAQAVVTGFTTDSTHYVKIVVPSAERHAGVWSTSKYRLVNTSDPCLYIRVPFCRVEGLQVDNTASTGHPAAVELLMDGAASATDIHISQCIVRKSVHRSSADVEYGISIPTDANVTNGVVRIYNCLVYDIINGNANATGVRCQEGDYTTTVQNCTIHNCEVGIGRSGGSVSATNTLFDSCGIDCGVVTETYCATTNDNTKGVDSGATGNRVSQTFTYEAGTDNFQLASTDAGARDYGTNDPGSGLYSDDIAGKARGATWDIGGYEYPATSPSTWTPRVTLML